MPFWAMGQAGIEPTLTAHFAALYLAELLSRIARTGEW